MQKRKFIIFTNFEKNLTANLLSQLYIAVVAIVFLPVYLKYLGPEAFGLVALYSSIQVIFNLLDMGLSPAVVRETSRFRGGAMKSNDYRKLIRILECIFIFIGLLGGLSLFFSTDYIATDWLSTEKLTIEDLILTLEIMTIAIVLRWICGLYRAVMTGFEKLVWLSSFNSLVASARFGLVILWLQFFGATATQFFIFQLGLSFIEFIVLISMAYKILPKFRSRSLIPINFKKLKPTFSFSLTIAVTSSIWVLLTQTDKVMLSNLLTLSEFGYYALAASVAAGVNLLGATMSGSLVPNITKLESENKYSQLIQTYRNATQFVSILCGSITIFISLFSTELVEIWTSDRLIADKVGPILSIYVIGNGLLAVSAFPSYLQIAKGNLRLHLIGNIIFVIIFVPLIYFLTIKHGSIGAASAWVTINLLTFTLWLPIIHKKFAPGLNLYWYSFDIGRIIVPMIMIGAALKSMTLYGYLSSNILALFFISFFILLSGCLSSNIFYKFIKKFSLQTSK